MIKRYALERLDGERFGDFVIRAGYIFGLRRMGKAWYESCWRRRALTARFLRDVFVFFSFCTYSNAFNWIGGRGSSIFRNRVDKVVAASRNLAMQKPGQV
ncbi:hypothetical protein BGW80DRAFT_1319115 [Lactifluus volemus]|nr:hypothetical protein BGW80DRAFT_1319115 [Lactifluus volemus]